MGLRYILRTLAATPGFTALAVATLALGIGVTTVVFTLYEVVAFRPLPVRAPEQIVRLEWSSGGSTSNQFSWREYERLANTTRSFDATIATSTLQALVSGVAGTPGTHAEIVRTRFVSPNYFQALGITPDIGRTFVAGDQAVAVVGHEYWVTKLHSDRELYGKKVNLQGTAVSIIGVAPEKFAGTGMPPQQPDIWMPASAQVLLIPGDDWTRDAAAREWQVLGRRRFGMNDVQVKAELAVLSNHWPLEAGKPVALTAKRATFFQMSGGAYDTFVTVCAVLMVGVGLVLLIACVNLTHLIAARNSSREHEIALRLALGASRWQVLKQLCGESLLLGVGGGIAGLLLSSWACSWLAVKTVETIEQITNRAAGPAIDLSPDWRVFAWTLAVSIVTGVAVGILPGMRASNHDVNSTLKQGAAGALGGVSIKRRRNILLTVQVASCLILLAVAGLLFRGAARSANINTGFDLKHLAVVAINTQGLADSPEARVNILRRALARMQAVPGIVSVAWGDRAPFLGTGVGPFHNEHGTTASFAFDGISEEYLATSGIPLAAGREFTKEEVDDQRPVAVISEAAAQQMWPGQDPIGRRITPSTTWLQEATGHESFMVIGVVKSVRSTYLSKDDNGYVYTPRALHDGGLLFLVRTKIRPEEALQPLSSALAEANLNLPARTVTATMEDGPVRIQELMTQAPAVVATVLGGLALLLAALGIYGVVSHLVSRRTREIGIRIALGAAPWDVISAVGGDTLRPVLWGVMLGLPGALGVSTLLQSLIALPDVPDLTYGAGAFAPGAFIGVLAILGFVIAAAAFAPMRRAIRVDAAVALRDE